MSNRGPMVSKLFIIHGIMLLGAVAAAMSAAREIWRRPMNRWRLLAPGLLATLATTILLGYPDILDLLQPAVWTLGLLAALVGASRGHWMGLDSDHGWRLVRLSRGYDGFVVALALALFATIQFTLELKGNDDSPYEPTLEFVMIVASGYLLGRSVIAWFRAGSIHHVDLHEL